MSEPQSITMLGQWLAIFRQLDEGENTSSEQVAELLDVLSEVLTGMVVDYELHGLETVELKSLIAKQRAYQDRILPKRFEVVDALMPLAARLVRQSELPTEKTLTKAEPEAPADPWALHCEAMEAKGATHSDTAKTWKAAHPGDNATIDELTKRSKNYRAERNRKRKAAENPR